MTVLLVSALRGIGSESSRLEALEAFRTSLPGTIESCTPRRG